MLQFNLLSRFKQNRIIVVDDEEFCIASMRALLGKAGIDTVYQVDYCITGLEALTQLKQAYESGISFKLFYGCYLFDINYKLILTDFNMPEMDGIEATKIMRTYLSEKKVGRKA